MADMRKYAGGGPEMRSESMEDHAAADVPGPRIIPTPEEARRAQEAARRAASGYVQPMVPSVYAEAGWESRIRGENGGRIPFAPEPPDGIARQSRAQDKLFSRSDILAILKARLAAGTGIGPDGLHAAAVFEIQYLVKTFENLE